LNFGVDSSVGEEFDGQLARITIWQGVNLSREDAERMYRGADPRSIKRGFLKRFYPMDGGGGSTVRDVIGGMDMTPASLVRGNYDPFVRKYRPEPVIDEYVEASGYYPVVSSYLSSMRMHR
jgi:hypothetical protein